MTKQYYRRLVDFTLSGGLNIGVWADSEEEADKIVEEEVRERYCSFNVDDLDIRPKISDKEKGNGMD